MTNSVPSIYNEGHPHALTPENAQIRWCVQRCHKCNCLFTVQLLANDIPTAYKCMSCDTLYMYNENELKNMGVL